MANDQLTKLYGDYKSLSDESTSILDKDAVEWTQEDAVRAAALPDEMKSLQGKITALEGLKAQTAEATKTLSESGGVKIPFSTQATATASNGNVNLPPGVQILGFQSHHETGVLQNGVLQSDSLKACFTDRQIKAMKNEDYSKAFDHFIRCGGQTALMNPDSYKMVQEGLDTGAGFVVPPDWQNRLIQKKPTPTRVNGRAQHLTTSRDRMILPIVPYATDDIYTSPARVAWTGETPSTDTKSRITESTFGQIEIPVYTALISVPITRDILEDSAVDIEQYYMSKFSETVDILYDDMILNGDGNGKPSGVLINPGGTNQPAVTISTNSGAADADWIQDIAWSMPEQYEDQLAWYFNKTNAGRQIAKLKDGDGRYLWSMYQESGLMISDPITRRALLGYNTVFSGLMPNIGTSTYPVVFGDMSGYVVVDRVGLTIQVLNEMYAQQNYIVVLGRIRFGGKVVEPWKLKIGQIHS